MAYGTKRAFSALIAGLFISGAAPLLAVDGLVLIDQNRAIAGSVTPGDAPGFPVTISISGSYRLSSNLTVPNQNTTAIQIGASAKQVSIDLNGFSILGPTTCDAFPPACSTAANDPANFFGPGSGILSSASGTLTIRNGTIRGMGRSAVTVIFGIRNTTLIDQLHVRENGHGGLIIFGVGNVYNSTVTKHGGYGIALNSGVVKGNLITQNAADGVASTGGPLTVLDNVIMQNTGYGISFGGGGGAYGSNTFFDNTAGHVLGGVQVSGNVCSAALCP